MGPGSSEFTVVCSHLFVALEHRGLVKTVLCYHRKNESLNSENCEKWHPRNNCNNTVARNSCSKLSVVSDLCFFRCESRILFDLSNIFLNNTLFTFFIVYSLLLIS